MSISKQLVVKFLGDNTQLHGVYSAVTSDAQKFDKEIKRHGVSMQAVGKIMLAAGGAIVGAMAATVVAVSKTGVEVDKFSKQTGVSREEIQKLGYAALQEHVSMEQLASGLTKLSKNMYDASMGTGEAKDTFDSLGISVKNSDGSLRNSSDVLLDVADKFKNMTNETEMSGAAMKIFGKSGAELVPFLRMGRDGIEDLKKEAERLGIVMSEDSVKGMKAFDDSVTAVKAGVGGFGTQIASALVPYMTKLADGLKSALEWFNKIPKPVREAVTVGTALAGVVALISGAFIVLGPAILTALAGAWPFIAAAAALGAAGILVYNNWNTVAAFFMTVWDKVVAATRIAWAGIRLYILTELDLILKGLQAFTGWIPGWGDKLKGAITAVEKQMHSATDDLHKNVNALTQNRYDEHYNWMVARNKKKNEDIQTDDNKAGSTKIQKTKEQLEKEKKAAEERAKIEEQANQALFQTKLQSTKNLDEQLKLQLKLLEAAKKKEIDEATKAGVSTASIEANYKLQEIQIRKDAADKKIEIERDLQKQLLSSQSDLTENLTEQKNIRLKLLEMEKEEAVKKATEEGTDVNKVKELYKNRADAIEKSYNDGIKKVNDTLKKELISSQQSLTKNLLEQKNAQLDLLKMEEDAAATQAAKEGQTQEQIAQIHQVYANKRLAIEQNYNDDLEATKRQQAQDLLNAEIDYLDKVASDERKSYTKRYNAAKQADALRLRLLDKERKEAVKKAKETGEDVAKVEEKYDLRRRNMIYAQEQAHKQAYQNMASQVVDYLDQLAAGEITLKEIIKNMILNWMSAEEELTIAEGIAGIAKAWAQAGGNPFVALPLIAPIIATTAQSIAGWEVGKAAVRGLESGGLAVGPSFNLIGEGDYDEAVLPLSPEVFNKIGEGIAKNQSNNTTNNNSSSQTVINNGNTYNLGRYVDKSGLKRLARDLEPIQTAEKSRKGQK
jgi:hypothetical protein